ncbi:MAG: serine hydrolase [Holophagales bacterium]|nr:serine hydrolase [Holophagales bacterium]
MAEYHAIGQFSGAWLVAESGSIVSKGGLGEANREWSVPNAADTRFNLGSITKPLTAALVLSLVDDGLLRLDGTISEYLTEYRPDVGSSVTIHDLLSHGGGFFMPRLSREEYDRFFQKKHTSEEIVRALTGTDPVFEPGARFAYSSAGYLVLGAIVERVTGDTYGEALRERILAPLGMLDTGVADSEAIVPRRAAGYQTNYGWGNAHFKHHSNSFSSGSLYSTVEDLYTWDQALRQGRILSAESRRLLFEGHLDTQDGQFGYGWFLADRVVDGSTVPIALHAGDTSGFSAIVVRSLASDQFIALLTNTEGTHYREIAFNLLGVLNGADEVEPAEYVADVLRRTIYTEGLLAALSRYQEIVSAGLDSYNRDEGELIELGHDLMYSGRPEEAAAILTITTEVHPQSHDAHYYLGKAQEDLDHRSEAVASYRRALELSPGDEATLQALARLGK